MKKNSFNVNILLSFYLLICMFVTCIFAGCYSFTGGSLPEHLKTLYIATVNDNSGYGNPKYREKLTQVLLEKFRSDNSLSLVDKGGDSKLYVSIQSVRDETSRLRPGEVESERKITVSCEAEFYDAVKKKSLWKKPFSNYSVYDLKNAQSNRDEAVNIALTRNADDILIAVVSGW